MKWLGVTVLALLVTSSPVSPPATDAAPTGPVEPRRAAARYHDYVALGDSWTADIGTSAPVAEGSTPKGCLQSGTDYPHQVAEALGVARFRDASCARAATRHLRRAEPVGDDTNPPQLRRLRRTTDLVTLGIGINDSRLVAAVDRCMTHLGLGSCRSAYVVDGVDQMSAAIKATRPRLARGIGAIRARAPRARILLVDYLAGLPSDGTTCSGISRADMTWFQHKLVELETVLRRVARHQRVELVDTYRPSAGHDMCAAADVRWVEGAHPLTTGHVGYPFHPDQAGADAQARIVLRAIRHH